MVPGNPQLLWLCYLVLLYGLGEKEPGTHEKCAMGTAICASRPLFGLVLFFAQGPEDLELLGRVEGTASDHLPTLRSGSFQKLGVQFWGLCVGNRHLLGPYSVLGLKTGDPGPRATSPKHEASTQELGASGRPGHIAVVDML